MQSSIHHPHALGRTQRRVATLLHPIVDRALHLDHADRSVWLADVCRGLSAFPSDARRESDAMLRGVVLHDAFNRIVLRGQLRFPRLALALARMVPLAGAFRAVRDVPAGRPIVFAMMHFGPVVFILAILQRLLRGRQTYALHAGGDSAAILGGALRLLGVVPLVCDERSLRTLAKTMADDPNCAVIIAFDYLGRTSRLHAPFLNRTVVAPRGLAFLADTFGAAVFTVWGDCTRRGPHVRIGELRETDRRIASARDRQDALTLRLFADLESQVLRRPQAWSEWRNASDAVV